MTASSKSHSRIAEAELHKLGQESQLENLVSTMNLGAVKGRFHCSDVFPEVKVGLLREQDRSHSKRVSLCSTVAEKLSSSLAGAFTGDMDHSKFVLRVNVTVVSNGCGSFVARRMSNLVKRDSTRASGMAKLTLAYCLYCRQTGVVAVAKQLSTMRERSLNDKRGCDALILDLVDELFSTIKKEIFFMRCNSRPSYTQYSLPTACDKPDSFSRQSSTLGESCSSLDPGSALE